MAKIVHSDSAPSGRVSYSLANVSFSLGNGQRDYETNNPVVIADAEAHPWLEVQHDPTKLVRGEYVEPSVRPEDDVLSAVNSHANDPEAVEQEDETVVLETSATDRPPAVAPVEDKE